MLKNEAKDIGSLGVLMARLEEIQRFESSIEYDINIICEINTLLGTEVEHYGKVEVNINRIRVSWRQIIEGAKELTKLVEREQAKYFKELKQSIKTFRRETREFREDFETNGPMVKGEAAMWVIQRLKRYEEHFELHKRKYDTLRQAETLFGLPSMAYPELTRTSQELENIRKLCDLYSKINDAISNLGLVKFPNIREELPTLDARVAEFLLCIERLPRSLRDWDMFVELNEITLNLQRMGSILGSLTSNWLEQRHWEAICGLTNAELNYTHPSFCIKDLMDAELYKYREDIEEIVERAEKEHRIRVHFEDIEGKWRARELVFSNWGKRENCILEGIAVQELIESLEEDQASVSSLKAQRFSEFMKGAIESLIQRFIKSFEILEKWIKTQKLWMSLEPVFTGYDISKQMPSQAKNFYSIDKTWVRLMDKAFDTKKFLECCEIDMVIESLPDMQKKLEECEKMLESYIENKRRLFPRFYFVSSTSLLRIISQTSELTSIHEDLDKIFEPVSRAEIKRIEKRNEKIIVAVVQDIGKEHERMALARPVACEGNIEGWLKSLDREMKLALETDAKRMLEKVQDIAGIDFRSKGALEEGYKIMLLFKTSLAQVGIMGLQLLWTMKMTEYIEAKQNRSKVDEAKKSLVEYIMKVLIEACLSNSGPKERVVFEALTTIHVYQKEVTDSLKQLTSVNDFEWQRQIRFYWRTGDAGPHMALTDCRIPYIFEYLGVRERLCMTALTTRCYITLVQALAMFYGGAPIGPAGTGKTETVKDLGRTVGNAVMVINCTDQHKARDLARIFKGLAQTGLWGCFDEFNRIKVAVLSVASMQIQAINEARRAAKATFNFPEEALPLTLVDSVGYFVTMNPDYQGRHELPENLKLFFRNVTMMSPNKEAIIKVKLAASGFQFYANLSRKLSAFYNFCVERISRQRHYDMGLRSILSVLKQAAGIKKSEESGTEAEEQSILVKCLKGQNFARLTPQDSMVFESLLNDVFPNRGLTLTKNSKQFEKVFVEKVRNRADLICRNEFVAKACQVYEQCAARHGVMLLGESSTGKSTITGLLGDTLGELEEKIPHRIMKLNPKAVTLEQLYGVKSEISDDWIPGIFSVLWEKANSKINRNSIYWIVCDGPVDTIWVENLNTVLDDNRILTLSNGERVPMVDSTRILFEVEHLNNASPATVSRCGQVHFSASNLSLDMLYEGWCQERLRERTGAGEEVRGVKRAMVKYLSEEDLLHVLELTAACPQPLRVSDPIIVRSFLNMLNGVLTPLTGHLQEEAYDRIVLFCLCWTVGALYEENGRARLSLFISKYLQNVDIFESELVFQLDSV